MLDAVDMISLVSARTELRRAGADSYFGLCPFHDERTPSFHVRPLEKHYHCFGCQASGDPFTFVMETEGLDFKAALESLATRFGVKLETEGEDPAEASRRARRERLYSLLGRAADYYARYLWEADEAAGARSYLEKRGIAPDTLKEFRVGYAPSAWDRMLRASRRAGFTEQELLATGLVQRSKSSSGQVYDRFRERIMFPAADARGRVLGFGARAMRDNQPPKYLNTSDGELYHKRSQLFGIDLARSAASRSGRVILVEGYTDVLALHQAGLRNSVGIMGTALTEEQVHELERVARVLELCLDADAAGQEAMLRAARLVSGRKLELRVVPLPPGSDPGDLIEREGADALRRRVESSIPFVQFHVHQILDQADLHNAEGRDRALDELRPVMAELPASAMRDELVRRIAGRLELPERRLGALIAGGGERGPADATAAGARQQRSSARLVDPVVRAERDFLALCVALPDAGARALAMIDPEEHLTSQRYRRAARHLAGQVEMPLTSVAPEDDELTRVLQDLVERAKHEHDVTDERLAHARLLLELDRIERALRRAKAERGTDLAALAREREAVRESIKNVGRQLERTV
ncbi:MAG: DNA primase [Solirubrobacterales bacterium]|nr:DNA primase [Solirubrobacterales bacterium]